jgi:hypothetical protein
MNYFQDKSYWLNEHGLVILQFKKQPHLFAHRDYHWVDKISIIDESDGRRSYSGSSPVGIFISQTKEENFIPILPEEYKLIKINYSEIKQIRRDLNLYKIL